MASVGPRPKVRHTYSRSSRNTATMRTTPQASGNNRAALSRSASDVPATAQTQTQTPNSTYDPYNIESSPEPPVFKIKKKTAPSSQNNTNGVVGRKRKVADIYSTNNHGHEPPSEDSSPAAPKPKQRSRVSSPTDNVAPPAERAQSNPRQVRPPVAVMDVDRTVRKLSSPPPTPIARKEKDTPGNGKLQQRDLPFSPNTMHMFGSLKVGDETGQHQIPVRPKFKSAASAPLAARNNREAHNEPSASASTIKPVKRQRKRLIDALVEQMEDSDDAPEEGNTGSQVSWSEPVVSSSQTIDSLDSQSSSQTSRTRKNLPNPASRTFARSGSSLRRTYGTERITLLEEDDIYASLDLPEDTGLSAKRVLELTPKKPGLSNLEDDDDPSSTSTPRKILGIYELKQAGANSRVADEMMDLSSEIGQPSTKPSSGRRAALLRIAEKAQQKDFRRRMGDHGLDAMILSNIGNETDPIAGFLIAVILLQILASSSAPHIIQLLQSEDAGTLFGRLLQSDEDLKKTARDRRTNLSKRSQGSLLALQTTLLSLPVWLPAKPAFISSRTAALKCLEILVTQDVHLGSDDTLFPPSVTQGLFDSLSAAQKPDFWDHQTPREDLFNVRCSLTILEFHAVKAMEAQNSEQLAAKYLPSVADAFGAAHQNSSRNSDLESLLLKLVLNMTNSSLTAPDIFISKELILPLSTSICASFAQSLSVVAGGEDWTEGLLEGLVLRLGILINFVEQSTTVKEAVFKCRNSGGGSPTNELIQLFLANHRSTAEADSEAKTQLNVAFGYLSVLLGYLCLYAPIRKVFKSSHSAKSMGPLADSIHEFISHHKAMEASLLEAGVDDPRAHGGYTERLQGLVDQLDATAYYD